MAGHARVRHSARAPLRLTLATALTQGAVLYLLTLAQINDAWPSGQPIWNVPLWTLAVAWPALLLFSIEPGITRRAIIGASLFASVLAAVAAYTGWQMSPPGAFPVDSIVAVFLITSTVACFKALMYLQPLAARRPVIYAELFANSWRNFIVAGLAAVMAGGIYLVLMLWASLLDVIGIAFFLEIFRQPWFALPAIAISFGLGVFIFRGLARVIDGLTGLLEGLMRLLLPLLVAMLAAFLAALPFTGLDPLWATGSGTALLMALNGLALFFVNAVYQTGRHQPYPRAVHRVVHAGVALLPIVAALALYGLSLRVAQYGWTVERCWAFAVCVALALFSCGYAGSVLRLRDAWPRNLAFVNRSMGLATLALVLLSNSPLLDFRLISLESQQRRVARGEIELNEFDFRYAREFLGRHGYVWTRELLEEYGDSDPQLAELIRNPQPPRVQAAQVEARNIWDEVIYRPGPFDVPVELRTQIDALAVAGALTPTTNASAAPARPDALQRRQAGALTPTTNASAAPLLVQVDLNDDAVMEYVFVDEALRAWAFQRRDDAWRALALQLVRSGVGGRLAGATIARRGIAGGGAPSGGASPGVGGPAISDSPGPGAPSIGDSPGAGAPSISDSPGADGPSISDSPGADGPSISDSPGAGGPAVVASPPGFIGPDGIPVDPAVGSSGPDALLTVLAEGTIETADPEFNDLRIGELTFRVVEAP